MQGKPKILGQLLLEAGAVRPEELDKALAEQPTAGRRIGRILVDHGCADESQVARCLALQLSLPYVSPPFEPEGAALALVHPDLARERGVLPLSVSPRSIRLVVGDPLDLDTIDDIRFQSGRRVEPVVAAPDAIASAIARAYGGELSRLVSDLGVGDRAEQAEGEDLEAEARAAPVVRLVDLLLRTAARERASDIHVEQRDGELLIRTRVDGILHRSAELPRATHRAVLSRIKIMAGMDISVRRRPQDGGFQLGLGDRRLTLRVSTLPVQQGEKAVLRLLDPDAAPADLEGIGLSPADLGRLRGLLRSRRGVVLAAGPTGSGKTSTLSGAIGEIDREALNLVTLEDPIEYRFSGVNQVQIHPKAGLTFPVALRSVLRQDPDVIMVGEIRDGETAEIAMAAAVTGHLVLSTIHTNDAPGAIIRLLDMGVPPFLVAGGLSGVVSQRLVRTLCATCRGRSGSECACRDGYEGRTGVFQVLVLDDALREAVARGAPIGTLRSLARASGMGTLADDARRKVAEGATGPHEIARVLRAETSAMASCPGCAARLPEDAVGCPSCGTRVTRTCSCGQNLEPRWRFCPGCLRKV